MSPQSTEGFLFDVAKACARLQKRYRGEVRDFWVLLLGKD